MVAHTGDAAARLELIEASDLLVVLRAPSTGRENEEIDVIKYAEAIGRSVIEVDPQTGARSGEFGKTRSGHWMVASVF